MDDLKKFREKIDTVQQRRQPKPVKTSPNSEGLNLGMRVLTELIGVIGIGGLIGYGLDAWLDTAPIFILIFILLAIITVFYNLQKFLKGYGENVGYSDLPKEQKDDTKTANSDNNKL